MQTDIVTRKLVYAVEADRVANVLEALSIRTYGFDGIDSFTGDIDSSYLITLEKVTEIDQAKPYAPHPSPFVTSPITAKLWYVWSDTDHHQKAIDDVELALTRESFGYPTDRIPQTLLSGEHIYIVTLEKIDAYKDKDAVAPPANPYLATDEEIPTILGLNRVYDLTNDEKTLIFAPDQDHVFYKVTRADLTTRDGFLWDAPTGSGKPGAWCKLHTDVELCSRGIHATPDPYIWQNMFTGSWEDGGTRLFEIELRGIVIDPYSTPDEKVVAQAGRLIREIPAEQRTDLMEKINAMQRATTYLRKDLVTARQISSKISAASLEGKLFVPANWSMAQDAQFLAKFIDTHNCPRCDCEIEGLRRRYHSRTEHTFTFDTDGTGSYDSDEDCSWDRDDEMYEYTCCGDSVQYKDFDDLIVFESGDFQDLVTRVLDDIDKD